MSPRGTISSLKTLLDPQLTADRPNCEVKSLQVNSTQQFPSPLAAEGGFQYSHDRRGNRLWSRAQQPDRLRGHLLPRGFLNTRHSQRRHDLFSKERGCHRSHVWHSCLPPIVPGPAECADMPQACPSTGSVHSQLLSGQQLCISASSAGTFGCPRPSRTNPNKRLLRWWPTKAARAKLQLQHDHSQAK